MGRERVSDTEDEAEMAATRWEIDVNQRNPEVDIVEIVSDLEGQEAEFLPPMYDTIDSLIGQFFSDPPPAEAQSMIQFTYHDYRIDIQQSGIVTFMKVSDDG